MKMFWIKRKKALLKSVYRGDTCPKNECFLEKVQTAFDPPLFFLEFFIAFFVKVHKYSFSCNFLGGGWRWPPLPCWTFSPKFRTCRDELIQKRSNEWVFEELLRNAFCFICLFVSLQTSTLLPSCRRWETPLRSIQNAPSAPSCNGRGQICQLVTRNIFN